jgi:hypothetical protein
MPRFIEKTPAVYIDTTIITGCCDPEYYRFTQPLLEDFRTGQYKPVISELVQSEMAEVPDEALDFYYELLKCDPEIIKVSEEADTLAEIYIDRKVLPENFYCDVLHLAMATLAEVDIFISADHPNILHFSKVRGFINVNLELGLKPIQIRCPRLVATDESKGC